MIENDQSENVNVELMPRIDMEQVRLYASLKAIKKYLKLLNDENKVAPSQ